MDSHFLPGDKLQQATGKKLDFETIKGVQNYTEKFILDILNRSALLARHCEKDMIEPAEIALVLEKDFDYLIGMRNVLEETGLPSNEHVERMAEISRQK